MTAQITVFRETECECFSLTEEPVARTMKLQEKTE